MSTDPYQADKFDALRAGLHVDDVDFKDACTPRLMDQQNTYWQRLVDALEEGVDQDRATCNRLRILRRKVLNGEHRKRSRGRGLPRLAAGAAASAALMVGAAVWWGSGVSDPAPVTRTASIDAADVDTTEVANNVDFYTWLESQTDTVADSSGN